MDYAKESLRLHKEWKGKIQVVANVPVETKDDLSLAYTPGVAQPCLEIQKDIEKSYELTRRWNMCLVVTDGSAVLGLGDIGPEAGMPVMEGKCVLFKAFGDVDAFPLCIKSKDVDEIVNTIYMISGDGSKMGGFSGTITDATTADYVEGVTLQLRSGWNNTDDGDVIKTLTTDEDGYFSYDSKKLFHVTFGLKSGNYTLTASKDGYTPMSFNVIVLPETDKGGQDATMSPIMAAEEYRVVLRWGAVPEDLDSHYNALSADGDEEHVYYSEMDSANAHLDVDDRDSYGPETITISGFENLKNGFTYSVHDYTNSDYDDSRELSASGATVQLYVSGKLVRTYHVPTGRVGTVWNVFSVDANGKITDLNTFESVSDPDNVGEQFRK